MDEESFFEDVEVSAISKLSGSAPFNVIYSKFVL